MTTSSQNPLNPQAGKEVKPAPKRSLKPRRRALVFALHGVFV